jgi:alkanesulfonate monooxygenase SsuD/methylene tetrahydromethanopterin reductase-like flavin-dependent oxidoreductase (luciferase family)
MPQPRFGFAFDMRNPPQWQKPWHDLYAEHLDFIAWTETIGFEAVWFAEHHAASDGYLPSPLAMAAAVASRTKTMRIGSAIALAPFYHPVRLAEDAAVIDIISNGRFDLALAIGYVKAEAERYGLDFAKRARRTDETLQIVRRLWQGETFSFEGEFYQLSNSRISPLPVSDHMPLWIGGNSPAAYRRAAKYGDGFFGPVESYQAYVSELTSLGMAGSRARIRSIGASDMWHLVSEDPERTIDEVLDHIVYQTNSYAEWQEGTTTAAFTKVARDDLRPAASRWVMTPEQSIAHFQAKLAIAPFESHAMMAPAGFPLTKMAEHAELFASKVLPAFR